MTGFDRSLARLKSGAPEADFADVRRVLEGLGYVQSRQRGSHVTFKKPGEPVIPPLEHYLGLEYTVNVIAAEEGGYLVVFPDLPGCFTQAETLDEAFEYAKEIRELWIEGEYEDGHSIPLPTYPEEYSGKFNLRIPKSLHRKLAESAEADGVSLNQYVTMLLSRGDAQARVEGKLEAALSQPGGIPQRQVAEDKALYG